MRVGGYTFLDIHKFQELLTNIIFHGSDFVGVTKTRIRVKCMKILSIAEYVVLLVRSGLCELPAIYTVLHHSSSSTTVLFKYLLINIYIV